MTIKRLEPGKRYSHVVVHEHAVYLSGVIADNIDANMEAQAKEVFAEIDRLLELAGASKSKLLSLQCYIENFDEFDQFNAAYDEWIDAENLPARATIQASAYDDRIKIEVVVVAAL